MNDPTPARARYRAAVKTFALGDVGEIVTALSRRTGINQSELIRRLVLAHVSGRDSCELIPFAPIIPAAVDAVKEILGDRREGDPQ